MGSVSKEKRFRPLFELSLLTSSKLANSKFQPTGPFKVVNFSFHSRYLDAAGDFDSGVRAVVKELNADILILEEVVEVERVVSREDYPYIEFHTRK